MGRLDELRANAIFFEHFYYVVKRIKLFFQKELCSDKKYTMKKYREVFGRTPDLEHPKTLNEKINWLKLNVHDRSYTSFVDKYAVRDYIRTQFGEEYLIPLLFETTDVRDIRRENMPTVPCILKANHDSGSYVIIRNRDEIDYRRLRIKCRYWLSYNYYRISKQFQYKHIKPRRIIIEKLLQCANGKIPNDYKLHYINGELQFVYVSYDREGVNDRCLFDKNWNRLPFVWVPADSYREDMNAADVPCPDTFELMKKFGDKVAEKFNQYVRVDFYDVDGKLYFGEITLHHGGGTDRFFPEKYDLIYGEKLSLGQGQ